MGFITKSEIAECKTIAKLEEPTLWQKRRFVKCMFKLCDIKNEVPYEDDRFDELYDKLKHYYNEKKIEDNNQILSG